MKARFNGASGFSFVRMHKLDTFFLRTIQKIILFLNFSKACQVLSVYTLGETLLELQSALATSGGISSETPWAAIVTLVAISSSASLS